MVIAMTALQVPTQAQTYDTLRGPNGKLPGYHYTHWFDSCDAWNDTTEFGWLYLNHTIWNTGWSFIAIENHVEFPALIKGFGVMAETKETNPELFREALGDRSKPRVAEYVYMWMGEPAPIGSGATFVDSARYDTAELKIYKVPMRADTNRFGFEHFAFFEVYLDTPIYVDGGATFLLGGTQWNNLGSYGTGVGALPTSYPIIRENTKEHCNPHSRFWFYHLNDSSWRCENNYVRDCSPYSYILPMIDFARVNTLTDDSTKGVAHPNCNMPKDVYQTISAEPYRGYYFLRWSDGDTTNPRRVFVTQDTTFTALFSDLPVYSVETLVDDPLHGSVTGGGRYFHGETIVLTANPIYPYRFSHWQDGDTSNPRLIQASQDDIFTAYFVEKDRYTLSAIPNFPERGTVTGSGIYYDGDTAILTATAETGYRFSSWIGDIYNYDNPRRVVVSQDTLFTARFSQWLEGIDLAEGAAALFSLTPNPTRESVTVTLHGRGVPATITVYDATGHPMLHRRATGRRTRLSTAGLPAGTYFVTVTTPQGTGTQKLTVLQH